MAAPQTFRGVFEGQGLVLQRELRLGLGLGQRWGSAGMVGVRLRASKEDIVSIKVLTKQTSWQLLPLMILTGTTLAVQQLLFDPNASIVISACRISTWKEL